MENIRIYIPCKREQTFVESEEREKNLKNFVINLVQISKKTKISFATSDKN